MTIMMYNNLMEDKKNKYPVFVFKRDLITKEYITINQLKNIENKGYGMFVKIEYFDLSKNIPKNIKKPL